MGKLQLRDIERSDSQIYDYKSDQMIEARGYVLTIELHMSCQVKKMQVIGDQT